ncbi:hypothetical protein [Paenibacillus hamazuiensis]|uniref:hypothetical protein n=1 Tax=Paenibacillus hamazuiensis TaxID=2936508 RepID=UPI00200D6E27|nr:hypothetical protein [Paenibacillus hamazuiensis]
MFVLSIILLCGYGLFVLLQPPADLYEEVETNEAYADIKLSGIGLPDYSKVHMSGNEE